MKAVRSQTIGSELRKKLKSAEYWGGLFDGSEDNVSVSSNAVFTSDFLGFIEPGAKRTAQDIVDGLMKLFNDAG